MTAAIECPVRDLAVPTTFLQMSKVTTARLGYGVYAILCDGAYVGDAFRVGAVNEWAFDTEATDEVHGWPTLRSAACAAVRAVGWRWRTADQIEQEPAK